ncbi:MAG: outer membrane lipoprotein-sorting protein, partial [Bacillota bacterium]
MRRRSLWWFIGLVTLCTALGSAATAAELSGREIVQRMETIDTVQDLIAELEMRIIHKSGMERVRHVSLATKRSPDGTEKALFRFLQPSDVKGTAFLSISRPGSPDENWLYLPALGKPRRIASEESGGSFMGSDFTYADIGSMRIDDFHHTLLRSETLENEEVYVVESVPASDKVKREVGFARRIWWVRKASFTLARAEFFSA